jgi:hypothetical protein
MGWTYKLTEPQRRLERRPQKVLGVRTRRSPTTCSVLDCIECCYFKVYRRRGDPAANFEM